jgi:poly(hydroxyalkanoate) granule-associated protein
MDGTKTLADDLMKTGRSVFLAGLGLAASTEERAREVFDEMVAKGEELEKDEKKLVARVTREAKDLGDRVERQVQKTVTSTLNRAGVPSRDEILELTRRVETLTKKVDDLAKK